MFLGQDENTPSYKAEPIALLTAFDMPTGVTTVQLPPELTLYYPVEASAPSAVETPSQPTEPKKPNPLASLLPTLGLIGLRFL